ncbi:MAG: hypothetical protein ACJ790_16720 [Myxococcaceae bacterium]
MRRVLAALCLLVVANALAAPTSGGAQVRLLLSIGSNYGAPDDAVLQFAEEDAGRFRDLFTDLGEVDSSRALLLQRPNAQQVRERFAEITGRVSELHAQSKNVQLVVFVSAHGRGGALHLTGSELPVSDLRQLAKDTGADLKLLIVDACESGAAVTRQKGARKGPSYALSIQPPAVTGDIFISSSGAAEAAQEWDVLSGSLFTHHWLTALRGDADFDGDGRVTLMEAYSYAARRTVAESIDVGQHPEFNVDIAGAQDVVLTEPKKSRAQVVLEDSLEGRFVLVSQPKPDVVAELYKQRGRPLKIAVPPGRYLIRQTAGFRVALQELELPYGGSAAVDAKNFVVRDFSEVAMKGGEAEFHPHAVRVSASALSTPLEGTPTRLDLGLAYREAMGAYWGSLAALGGKAQYRGVNLNTNEWRFAGRASAGFRFWLGPIIVMPGLGIEASLLRQSYVRDDEAAIRRSYGPLPQRNVWGYAAGPQLFVEAPIVGPLFLSGGVSGWVRNLPVSPATLAQNDAPEWTLGGDAEIALGVRW